MAFHVIFRPVWPFKGQFLVSHYPMLYSNSIVIHIIIRGMVTADQENI